MFLDVALGTKSVPPADAVCRAIVEQSCQNGSTTQGMWNRLIEACAGDLFRAMAGIFALVGEEGTPILHALARATDVGSLRSTLGKVVSLVSVVPTLPIVVTTTPERLEEYLASTPECRSLALVREGVVWLADDPPAAPASLRGTAPAAAGSTTRSRSRSLPRVSRSVRWIKDLATACCTTSRAGSTRWSTLASRSSPGPVPSWARSGNTRPCSPLRSAG